MYLKALICDAKLTWFLLLLVQSCHTTVWRLEGRSDNVQYAQFHFYAHLPLFGQGFGLQWMIVVKYETWERWIRLCLISLKAKSELHKAYIKLYYLYINIYLFIIYDRFFCWWTELCCLCCFETDIIVLLVGTVFIQDCKFAIDWGDLELILISHNSFIWRVPKLQTGMYSVMQVSMFQYSVIYSEAEVIYMYMCMCMM